MQLSVVVVIWLAVVLLFEWDSCNLRLVVRKLRLRTESPQRRICSYEDIFFLSIFCDSHHACIIP